jgi:hypothetical protein
MFGVEQPYLIDTFLQREKHWLPIHSGRLHTDQLHVFGRQPVPELAQPARGRRKRARRDPPLAPFRPRRPDRRHHRVPVHIQPCTTVDQLFHRIHPASTLSAPIFECAATPPACGAVTVKESEVRARSSTTGCPNSTRHTFFRARGTKRRRRQIRAASPQVSRAHGDHTRILIAPGDGPRPSYVLF